MISIFRESPDEMEVLPTIDPMVIPNISELLLYKDFL